MKIVFDDDGTNREYREPKKKIDSTHFSIGFHLCKYMPGEGRCISECMVLWLAPFYSMTNDELCLIKTQYIAHI